MVVSVRHLEAVIQAEAGVSRSRSAGNQRSDSWTFLSPQRLALSTSPGIEAHVSTSDHDISTHLCFNPLSQLADRWLNKSCWLVVNLMFPVTELGLDSKRHYRGTNVPSMIEKPL